VRLKMLVLAIFALAVLSVAIAGIVAANDKSRFKTALSGYEEATKRPRPSRAPEVANSPRLSTKTIRRFTTR